MKFYIGSGFKNAKLVNELASQLLQSGWQHTYNWANSILEKETKEDMIRFSQLEQQAILDSDVIIILLPAGRGTHIELGMALAFEKKIYLCSTQQEAFQIENTVNFYELPQIRKIVGNIEEISSKIIEDNKQESSM